VDHTAKSPVSNPVESVPKKGRSISVKKVIDPGFDNPIYGQQKDNQPDAYPVAGATEDESSPDYEEVPISMISKNAVVYNIPLDRAHST